MRTRQRRDGRDRHGLEAPFVVGVALILLWGSAGLFGFVENDFGWKIIFSFPGIVLASIFVTVPFVIHHAVPGSPSA